VLLEGYVVVFVAPFVLLGTAAWGRSRGASWNVVLARCLLATSLLWIVSLTLFPFDTNMRMWHLTPLRDWQLIPFRTIRSMLAFGLGNSEFRQLAGNVALFAPLGAALPLAVPRCRNPILTIAAGALLSFAIEFAQAFLPAHGPDVDDVLLNSLGAGVGYVAYALVALTLSASIRRDE
jgi:glycopeptide antibiotics resistance protein